MNKYQLVGLGCPGEFDCNCLNGLGQVPASIDGKLFKSVSPFTAYSKAPWHWFPLINNEKSHPAGTFVGRPLDADSEDGDTWVEFNTINPGWVRWNKDNFIVQGDAIKGEPDEKTKEEILKSIPGGEAYYATKKVGEGVAETVSGAFDLVGFLGNNLKTILILGGIGVAGYYAYRYRNLIFNLNKKANGKVKKGS